jgi:hypothetical protein
MSILLEGISSYDENDSRIWTGNWQFIKDKKSFQTFNYKVLKEA